MASTQATNGSWKLETIPQNIFKQPWGPGPVDLGLHRHTFAEMLRGRNHCSALTHRLSHIAAAKAFPVPPRVVAGFSSRRMTAKISW